MFFNVFSHVFSPISAPVMSSNPAGYSKPFLTLTYSKLSMKNAYKYIKTHDMEPSTWSQWITLILCTKL